MGRKIIQLCAATVSEGPITQCEMYLHALCNDGTVWRISNREIDVDGFWSRVPSIPQDDEPLPASVPDHLKDLWTVTRGSHEPTQITSDEQILACEPGTVTREYYRGAVVRNITRWADGNRHDLEMETIKINGRSIEIIVDLMPF